MMDAFLSDFTFIRDSFEKDGDVNFFGKDFSFFSAEPILFYNSDKDVIVYANSRFADEFNFSVDDLKDWKYSIYPLLNTEDQEPFRNAIKAFADGGEQAVFADANFRLVNKNKKFSYYRVKVRKLHKSNYYISLENSARSAIPVLKNKTADELITDAESILKFGFWMFDVLLDKLYWTKGMYRLMEYEGDDDLESLSLSPEIYRNHIIKNDAYLVFEKRLQAGQVKNSYRNKYQLTTNKGRLLTVAEHAQIQYDDHGKISRIVGLTRDITIQEESMKSLADYKSMMQENEAFLNYGSWESDKEGKTVFWSDGMYKIFGYGEEARKNVEVNEELYAKHISRDDYAKGHRMHNEFDPEQSFYQWDYEIKDNNGAVRILSTYGKIIRDNNQAIQKIIGITRDVTELQEYERALENKVAELDRSNHELEEFAYVASHDLQEPLRKISTFGQRLQLKYTNELGTEGNLYIERIRAASENMRQLIENLLELSRINRDKEAPKQIELRQVIDVVLEELDMKIEETNANITIGELPTIEAVFPQMKQLFVNLINNALKFRQANVQLQINISSRQLTGDDKKQYALPVGSDYFMITIADNGIGFEQQYAEKIFQVFQRLQGKSEYPGTGIGLSICKKIVLRHNGLIYSESEPGKGASFFIILPQFQ